MFPMSDRMTFAHWLQREREQRDWSQNELATRAGIGRGIVNKTEAGRNDPAPQTLRALARALGYPVDRLYRLVGFLPSDPGKDPLTEEGLHILQQLEGEDKEDAIRYLRLRRQVQEERRRGVRKRRERSATA